MISRELERIIQAKNSIKQSIINKGVSVGNELLDEYPALIDLIATGSTAVLGKLDKTIVQNGDFLFNPTKDGWDGYSRAVIRVNVPPKDNGFTIGYGEDAFANNNSLEYVGSVTIWDASNTSLKGMFRGCENLRMVDTISAATITDVSELFSGCLKLHNIPYYWNSDTSNLTDMSGMFCNCQNLLDGNGISNFNTSNVVDISNLFYGCRLLQMVNFNNCDFRKVRKANGIFSGCENLGQIQMQGTKLPKLDLYDWGLEETSYLDRGSIISIANALPQLETGESYIVKIGDYYLSQLTETQIQLFTDKGWVVM